MNLGAVLISNNRVISCSGVGTKYDSILQCKFYILMIPAMHVENIDEYKLCKRHVKSNKQSKLNSEQGALIGLKRSKILINDKFVTSRLAKNQSNI